MDIDGFIKNIENYYCPYAKNATVKMVLDGYLSGFTSDQLNELFQMIVLDYSNTYKTPPDVSRFKECWEKKYRQAGLIKKGRHYEDEFGNVYDSGMQKIGHYDSGRFIPFLMDPRIREKVLTLGSERITPERYLEYKQEVQEKSLVVKDK